LRDTRHEVMPEIDFAAHAAAMGALAVKVASIAELERRCQGNRGERPHDGASSSIPIR
jgi:3D-(3,5/4)-trihydroxycyclohexane-1,2-dione acylhydrolase (decyclizing)